MENIHTKYILCVPFIQYSASNDRKQIHSGLGLKVGVGLIWKGHQGAFGSDGSGSSRAYTFAKPRNYTLKMGVFYSM